jgi:pimeloyl-ACP methyl ester carboxylesterase
MTEPTVTRTEVRFGSSGVDCAGYLYRPAKASGTLPCVVLGHGTAGTMDRLFVYAEPFAAAGMAVLVFDYRGWGASDGQPRQVINIGGQLDDWRAAIGFARSLDGVDPERIALWGSSLSGGHVVALAAEDPRIAAVVAQVPWFGDARTPSQVLRQLLQVSTLKLVAAGIRDAVRGARDRPPYLVPIVGEPGQTALFTGPEVREALEAKGLEGSLWRNEFAPRFVFALPRYQPGKAVERLGMPLLVCVADRDRETPADFAARFVERAPRGELRRYPASHFEMYHGETFKQVLADQVDFLRSHLLSEPADRR